jgi:hypothetical protein
MRSPRTQYLLSLAALPAVALAAFLSAQSSNAIRGDVNNDGQVTTLDALAVMSHVVGKTLPTGYTMVPNGDANGDGQVTAADALVILSYVVGKDVSQFPVGKGVVTLSVTPTSATIARGETRQLSASVTGATNTAVTWRSSAESVATVSGSGLLSGVAPGEATITAISQADTLARATARITVTQAAASNLVLVSGNAQSATVGTQLPNALVVRVTDAANNPVSGTAVAWAVTAGGGTVTQTSTTDTNGQAVATWTLGTVAGDQTATATVGSQALTFTAKATPAAAAKLESLNGGGQTAPAGTTLPTALLVRVVDPHGNAVPGVNVTWTPAAGSGSVNPTVSTSNNEGFAGSTWTVGTEAGEDTVTASAPGLAPTIFRATVTAGTANKLEKVAGDAQTGTVGQTLPDTLVVRVLDASNNAVSGVVVVWKAVGANGQITPDTAVTDAAGRAKATWMLDTIAGGDTARAVLPGADSVVFTATGVPGTVGSLAIAPADSVVYIDAGGTKQLSAILRDRYGNTITDQQTSWTLSDAAVATVDKTGLVRGVGDGRSRVIATYRDVADTSFVVVDTRVSKWGGPSPNTPIAIREVWGTSPTNIYAVGRDTIFRFDGTAWSRMVTPTTDALMAIWGASASDIYAVGSGGTILRFDGVSWSKMQSGTSTLLRDVWGTGANNVYAVGDSGVIVRYDGSSWRRMHSGVTSQLFAISGSAPDSIYVAAGSTLLRYDGSGWSRMNFDFSVPLTAVWSSSEGILYASGPKAVGSQSMIYRYDGRAWTTTQVEFSVADIWGSSPSNVYAVGSNSSMCIGPIIRFDGVSWKSVHTVQGHCGSGNLARPYPGSVWGLSSKDVWVSGWIERYETNGSIQTFKPNGFTLHGTP